MSTERQTERHKEKRAYDREWAVLPTWVKWFSYAVGGPSFTLLVLKAFTERVSDSVALVSFLAFAAVCFVQIFYGWRARKRNEL